VDLDEIEAEEDDGAHARIPFMSAVLASTNGMTQYAATT